MIQLHNETDALAKAGQQGGAQVERKIIIGREGGKGAGHSMGWRERQEGRSGLVVRCPVVSVLTVGWVVVVVVVQVPVGVPS